jgi:hypothetical protein
MQSSSEEAHWHSACGRLWPWELGVGMLGGGDGVGDSILVLTEEQEMAEGRASNCRRDGFWKEVSSFQS